MPRYRKLKEEDVIAVISALETRGLQRCIRVLMHDERSLPTNLRTKAFVTQLNLDRLVEYGWLEIVAGYYVVSKKAAPLVIYVRMFEEAFEDAERRKLRAIKQADRLKAAREKAPRAAAARARKGEARA